MVKKNCAVWKPLSEDTPSPCVVILSMGRDPKTGEHYDVVCSASKIDGHWYANACQKVENRIRAWTYLPACFQTAFDLNE